MDTVPQTVNCVDVLPRTSRHLHSHLLWMSLEPGHCHCAECLMEQHMNISKPSVNKSNTGVRTLIFHHKRRTLVTLKILFFVEQENAWDFHCAEWERETHWKCVSLTQDVWDLAGLCLTSLSARWRGRSSLYLLFDSVLLLKLTQESKLNFTYRIFFSVSDDLTDKIIFFNIFYFWLVLLLLLFLHLCCSRCRIDSSHMTASSSASWSRFSPPWNFVNGQVSTVWFMVCRWP